MHRIQPTHPGGMAWYKWGAQADRFTIYRHAKVPSAICHRSQFMRKFRLGL